MNVSLIIPTWNGADLLRRYLPVVLAEIRSYTVGTRADAEVIVVDDASNDDTVAYLSSLPVKLIQRQHRGGFSKACNSGIDAARYPFAILLNNDVRVAHGFISALLEPLAGAQVFATTARVFEPASGLLATAGKIGAFRKGFWSVYFNFDLKPGHEKRSAELLSAYAVGGFCAFRVEQARLWGGFDEMFSPFHWEDIDFSYRAWKRGWKVVYQPRALAWHQASSTIGRTYRSRDVEVIAVRNRLLFHWKNLHHRGMLLQHIGMIALLFLSRWAAGDFRFYSAFLSALKMFPDWSAARAREKKESTLTDGQVRELLNRSASSESIAIYRSQRDVEQRHHERLSSADYVERSP